MQKKAIKRRCAKIMSTAVALTMAAGMFGTSVFASASIRDKLDVNKKYESQYDSFDDVLRAGEELNSKYADEGFVLLKNRENALPLAKRERNVTVLGSAADTLSTGGGGSGSQSRPGGNRSSVASAQAATIFESLEAVGITANPRIRDRYLTVNPVTQTVGRQTSTYEASKYMDIVENGEGEVEFAGKQYKSSANSDLAGADSNLSVYNDVAIVVISRTGAEGNDNASHNVPYHTDTTDHYLELNDSERELMAYAKLHFNKVVVIVNSPSVMELGDLNDDDGISAILWVGQPGWNGIMAVGRILTGEVNPSGKTVDFYMRKFESDPVWYNSNNYTQADYALTGQYTNRTGTVEMEKSATSAYEPAQAHAIDYAEGIYMGYRYYETVAEELTKAGEDGEAWYRENVVYPFGYGLSYTSFEQKIVDVEGNLNDPEGDVTVKVEVTNTGKYAGKDVVQLYNTAEYTPGGIEKAAVELVGFTKTAELKAGQSQTVEITVAVKDLASFDYNDANENDFCGYELEKGNYVLSIRRDSHTLLDSKTLSADDDLGWDEDGNPATPNNIFSQGLDSPWGRYNTLAYTWTQSHEDHYLTRDKLVDEDGELYDLTKLSWLLTDDNLFTEECMKLLTERVGGYSYDDWDNILTEEVETDYTNVWTKTEADIPDSWTQGTGTGSSYAIQLVDMIGIDPNGTTAVASGNAAINGKTGKEAWIAFMNQLTWDELINLGLGRNGAAALGTIGRTAITDADGPGQLVKSNGGWAWVCEVVIASTWNTELAYEQGVIVGNESIWLNTNGWWGPGMNIHRSPLSGRNFEYYSQDGIQGGLMAAAVVKGATDMGVHVFSKHAFLNDQETNRDGTVTFVNEQSLRQIYAKCFELSVRKGNSDGLMSSFNLIGIDSSASYAVNYQMYKNEWGFEGYSITDMYVEGKTLSGWPAWALIRGNTVPLNTQLSNKTSNYDNNSSDGTWDATARNGKGMVTVPAYDAATKKPSTTQQVASPTLWYFARELAQNILYDQANGNAMDAGFSSSYIAVNTSLNLGANTKIGNNVNILTAESIAQLDEIFGSTGYEVTATGLPIGVTLSKDGALSGAPLISGSNKVTVTVTGKYGLAYVTGSQSATITVGERTVVEKLNENVVLNTVTAAVGDVYSAAVTGSPVTLTADNYVENGGLVAENVGKYVSKTYTATGLPAGLSIDATTGAITGTPTETGKFEVSVSIVYAKVVQGRRNLELQNETYTSVYAFTVSGGYNITFNSNGEDVSIQNAAIKTGETATFGEIKDYINTPVNGNNVFVGWATTANAKAPNVTDETVLSKETTLYAVWQLPDVAIVDGVWWVNGINTGISVQGTPGQNGLDGLDGADGLNGANGINGVDGLNGVDGKGVASAVINESGELVLTYTDGTTANLGVVKGADGVDGKDGKDGSDGAAGKGCGGSIDLALGMGVAILAVAGVAGIVFIRRRNNSDK